MGDNEPSRDPAPDLAPAVVAMSRRLDGMRSWTAARVVLAVCAIEVIAFSIPDLASGGASHDARHLGAFSIAFGVALLVVVVRPARARTMLPVAMVLGLALTVTALVDLIDGRVPLVSEARHLAELISIVALWWMADPSRRLRRAEQRDLHLVTRR